MVVPKRLPAQLEANPSAYTIRERVDAMRWWAGMCRYAHDECVKDAREQPEHAREYAECASSYKASAAMWDNRADVLEGEGVRG